jgi:hypothetical protein
MPLSSRFVDEIHMRLAVRYGSAWLAKWQGVEIAAVKADWAEQLDGMRPENIRKALDNLPPDFPPTCTAFRSLGVIRHEAEEFKALPAPEASPAVVKAAVAKLRRLSGNFGAKHD